jgi:hypothetical protein
MRSPQETYTDALDETLEKEITERLQFCRAAGGDALGLVLACLQNTGEFGRLVDLAPALV